jgi:hypothetical protein
VGILHNRSSAICSCGHACDSYVSAKNTRVYARRYKKFLDGQLGSITVSCEVELGIVWEMLVRVLSVPCVRIFSDFPKVEQVPAGCNFAVSRQILVRPNSKARILLIHFVFLTCVWERYRLRST